MMAATSDRIETYTRDAGRWCDGSQAPVLTRPPSHRLPNGVQSSPQTRKVICLAPEDIVLILPQLTKEYVTMQKEPPPFVWAAPDEKNILNCAFPRLLVSCIYAQAHGARLQGIISS